MLRPLSIVLLAAILAAVPAVGVPATALAQGAGDDQYADPFGDMPVDNDGGGSAGGDTGGGDTGTGSAPADTGEAAPDTSGTTVAADDTAAATEAAAPAEELPRTGLPAGLLALVGVALLACGTLIHLALLRLAPNSVYARALSTGPLHLAPRPPGFEPLSGGRRIRRSRRR